MLPLPPSKPPICRDRVGVTLPLWGPDTLTLWGPDNLAL